MFPHSGTGQLETARIFNCAFGRNAYGKAATLLPARFPPPLALSFLSVRITALIIQDLLSGDECGA